jgi:hypothetical protein
MVLGALEEMGPVKLSADAIVRNSTSMVLYAIKVSCTKRLARDLWVALKAKGARADIEWVSSYNFWKADMATRPTHLITNIPSLQVAWDVTSVLLPIPRIRGVVPPDYSAHDFMGEFFNLRKAFSVGGKSE